VNEEKRDELLIRIDERQKAVYEITLSQEKHLASLNAKVAEHVVKIAVNRNDISELQRVIAEGVPIRFTGKQYAAGALSILTISATLFISVGKFAGWW